MSTVGIYRRPGDRAVSGCLHLDIPVETYRRPSKDIVRKKREPTGPKNE